MEEKRYIVRVLSEEEKAFYAKKRNICLDDHTCYGIHDNYTHTLHHKIVMTTNIHGKGFATYNAYLHQICDRLNEDHEDYIFMIKRYCKK